MLERHRAAAGAAFARHHELLRNAVEANQGVVFETVGDAVYAAFSQPVDAVLASVAIVRALEAEDWGEIRELRARIAINTGSVEARGRHYFGPPLFECARLESLVHGGQEVAQRHLDDYADGAWIVELAPVSDPELVLGAVADTWNLRAGEGTTLDGVLLHYLSTRRLLLIIDNCEHVVDAAAALVDRIVKAGYATTLLVTSREPLGVPGETVYRVPSLGLPEAAGATVGPVGRTRARAHRRAELPAVASSCRSLGVNGVGVNEPAHALPLTARLLRWHRHAGDHLKASVGKVRSLPYGAPARAYSAHGSRRSGVSTVMEVAPWSERKSAPQSSDRSRRSLP